MIPHPSDPRAPKYWMYEQGGELRPAIERFLNRRNLTNHDIALIRAYFRQWIDSPAWEIPYMHDAARERLGQLRRSAARIGDYNEIVAWLADAGEYDPL